jgi:hypothetical protein
MAYFTAIPPTIIVRPICSCGARMWLTRIQPDKPSCVRRFFECPRCQNEMTEVAEFENAG